MNINSLFVGGRSIGFLVLVGCVLSGCGLKRLHQIDEQPGGFALYRSGQPKDDDAEQLCEMNVMQIFALNGDGRKYAQGLQEKCPNSKIVYNEVQEPNALPSTEFLADFDRAVAAAKAAGHAILFHCSCGCHRTGRLAAYYRMKYQGWHAERAIIEMYAIGDDMDHHPYLPAQVRAMEDYIRGRPCSAANAPYCIPPASAPSEAVVVDPGRSDAA